MSRASRRTLVNIKKPVLFDHIFEESNDELELSSCSEEESGEISVPAITSSAQSLSIEFEEQCNDELQAVQPETSASTNSTPALNLTHKLNDKQLGLPTRRENAQIHIFAATLLETLCAMYEKDETKRKAVINHILENLQEHHVIWPMAFSEELQPLRRQYLVIFDQIIQNAVHLVVGEPQLPIPRSAALTLMNLGGTRQRLLLNGMSHISTESNQSRYRSEFTQLACIGRGGFGKVYKVRHNLDGSLYAMKVIYFRLNTSDDGERCRLILREVKLLASLYHNHIVRYNSAWIEQSNRHRSDSENESTALVLHNQQSVLSDRLALYIQMELCHSTLHQWIDQRNKNLSSIYSCTRDAYRAINKSECLILCKQLIQALAYLHSKDIIHRDIKTRNIFCNSNLEIKLGDFGLAREIGSMVASPVSPITPSSSPADSMKLSGGIGTSLYTSPEQKQGSNYDVKADTYSLAICIYELLNVFSTDMERHHSIELFRDKHQLNEHVLEIFPKQCDVLLQMIDINPNMRPSAVELLHTGLCLSSEQMISYLEAQVSKLQTDNEKLKSENEGLKLTQISSDDYGEFLAWRRSKERDQSDSSVCD